jgi:hypothetical protein
MIKALIAGVAGIAHGPIEQTGHEPFTRTCAYLEAIGACALIICAAVLLS